MRPATASLKLTTDGLLIHCLLTVTVTLILTVTAREREREREREIADGKQIKYNDLTVVAMATPEGRVGRRTAVCLVLLFPIS